MSSSRSPARPSGAGSAFKSASGRTCATEGSQRYSSMPAGSWRHDWRRRGLRTMERQTAFRGHPVFVAHHATACCCRGCLQKWHCIPRGHELTATEREYVVAALEQWLRQQAGAEGRK
jgi:Domain of unknown function (DUF4186)